MSRKQKIKHMSSDELQAKLYSHFQKSGSIDHLRAQIRGQLVSELFKIAEPVDSNKFPNVCDVEKCMLPLQVCNWLVFDHLSRQDYQYSLSTFVTEAQLPYPEKFLTAGDVIGLLGLKNTEDFENITKLYSINNELGVLHSLLLAMIKTMFSASNKELFLDGSYLNSEANCEKILQEDVSKSFTQNKSEAVSNMSFQDLPQPKQASLSKSFLSNDEIRTAEMQFQRSNKEMEKEVQKMRRRLLDELDSFHSQKRKLELELEHERSQFKKEQSKLLKEKETLKEQAVLYEKELTNQFEMKFRNLESEFAEKLHFKDKEIESLKRKFTEKDEKLTYLEVELSSEKESNNQMKQELKEMKSINKSLQDKYSSALDQNTNLLRKFENMSDYSLVKEELSFKSREVARLQNEIKDLNQKSEAERRKYVEIVRNLENNLEMKESELIQAKGEIDDSRNNLKREQSFWSKEKKKIEYEHRELKDRYEAAMQKLEEKNTEIEDLHQTIHVLSYKLRNKNISTAKSESVGTYKTYQSSAFNQKNYSGLSVTKRNMPFQQQSEKDYSSKFTFFFDKKRSYNTLKQEEKKVQEKYSILYSTMPDCNKQVPFTKNYNFISSPKESTDSYDIFHKPFSINSSFNYGKSKISTVTKNPYPLADDRLMLSHSSFPCSTSKQKDFQANLNDLVMPSQLFNIGNTQVKDSWKLPESNNSYNLQKRSLTETNDITLNAIKNKSSLSKSNSTSENLLHLSSLDKNVAENHETLLNSKDNNEVSVHNDNQDKLRKNSESTGISDENGFEKNTNENVFDVNKRIASTEFQNSKALLEQENAHKQNLAISVQPQTDLVDSSQHLHNTTSKILEKTPESNFSVFINLDDAWKKRPSLTSLPYTEGRITNLQNRQDSSLNSTNASFISEHHTFDSSLKKQDEIESEDIINKSVKNNGSDLNLEKECSLHDKTVEDTDIDATKANTVGASNELLTSNKETDYNDTLDRNLPLKEIKQVSSSDEGSKQEGKAKLSEEEANEKSSVKTGTIDTLSEQSELHLSCGSEAEEQKEDSDAW